MSDTLPSPQNSNRDNPNDANPSAIEQTDYDRRFAGANRIYSESNIQTFENSHVMVIGIGGVGSWAVEALARSGVGKLTLIDMDVIVASNVNRQLPALSSTFGHAKIDVMAQRCREINPQIQIELIDDFLTPDNVTELLADRPDLVLDCIDDVKAKLALILHCRFNKIPLIVSGGAGGKLDPLKIRVADLSKTEQDPMLAKLRTQLRSKGICKKPKEKFGITCVYSVDNPFSNAEACGIDSSAGLRCGGYGSAVVVTSSFAMVAVAEVLKKLSKAQ